jgi:hypothetical protein
MKKKLFAMGLGMALAASAAMGELMSWDVDALIPDDDPTGLQDTRELSGFTDVIGTLEVWLKISAATNNLAWNGDLYVTLQHDSGYAVLLNRVGRTDSEPLGYDHNGFEITFALGGFDVHNYQANSPIFGGAGQLTGTWGVDGRNVDPGSVLASDARTDMLESFVGINPNGAWTLFVADLNQNAEMQLDSWGLNVTPIPEPGTFGLLALGAVALWRRRRRM